MTTTNLTTLTLNLDPELLRRLELAASRKGISVERYCIRAIEKELAREEAKLSTDSSDTRLTAQELIARRKEAFGDRIFPGDSADLIREAREIRNAQMDEWS